MQYAAKKTMTEFERLMRNIKKNVPEEYEAFLHEKSVIMKGSKLPAKTKWLMLLVASVTAKCPVCIPRAVKNCLEAGWTRAEMLEACMVSVLVGGSSAMTFVTLVEKSIEELSK